MAPGAKIFGRGCHFGIRVVTGAKSNQFKRVSLRNETENTSWPTRLISDTYTCKLMLSRYAYSSLRVVAHMHVHIHMLARALVKSNHLAPPAIHERNTPCQTSEALRQ